MKRHSGVKRVNSSATSSLKKIFNDFFRDQVFFYVSAELLVQYRYLSIIIINCLVNCKILHIFAKYVHAYTEIVGSIISGVHGCVRVSICKWIKTRYTCLYILYFKDNPGLISMSLNANISLTPFNPPGYNGFGSVADGIEPVGNMVDDCKPDGSHPAITG